MTTREEFDLTDTWPGAFYDKLEREALQLATQGSGEERRCDVFDSTLSESCVDLYLIGILPGSNALPDTSAAFSTTTDDDAQSLAIILA